MKSSFYLELDSKVQTPKNAVTQRKVQESIVDETMCHTTGTKFIETTCSLSFCTPISLWGNS